LAFLEKPITLQKLLKAVEQGLSRKPVQAAMPKALQVAQPHFTGSAGHTLAPLSVPLVSVTANQAVQSFDLNAPLREARDSFEKAYFEYHLAQEAGSMTRVAEKTGLERTHLYRKLKQLGVDLSRGKRASA
jgi:DNA-binding NtrC family response regulator